MTTGDGQLAALQFLSILGESGKTGKRACRADHPLPADSAKREGRLQRRKNGDSEQPGAWHRRRQREEVRLTGRGRILLRASGTEPLIRVMAEADTQDLAESVVKTLVEAVENVQKILKK